MTSNELKNNIIVIFLLLSMTDRFWFLLSTSKPSIVPIPVYGAPGDFHNETKMIS